MYHFLTRVKARMSDKYKEGYQAAEKFYQARINEMQAENDHLNRSKGAAKALIKKLKAEIKGELCRQE